MLRCDCELDLSDVKPELLMAMSPATFDLRLVNAMAVAGVHRPIPRHVRVVAHVPDPDPET
jgi:hypothetical protein